MKYFLLFAALTFLAGPSLAQPKATNMEKLPLAAGQDWAAPRFSPDGTRIFYTRAEYDGIWEYTPATKTVRTITTDPKSGYGFAVSADGRNVAYRRLVLDGGRRRTYEIVSQELTSSTSVVQARGQGLSVPSFARSALVYSAGKQAKNLNKVSAASVTILGIENTKIALLRNGQKVLFDPLGNGSYIWPALSPDGTRLVAYEMDHGAFVCDLDGNLLAKLGRRDAPAWTRNGKWLVYMNDKDDGDQLLSSDLRAVSSDGIQTVDLTSTPDVMEMYPDCSPTDNRIVCSSAEGDLYLISYTEEPR
jgi:Tol biopolymer transport system component